jgi:dihydropteroate synthase
MRSGIPPSEIPQPFRPKASLRIGDQRIDLGERTLIMGVINCTPDSFHDGGRYHDPEDAVRRYHQMIEEGADWVDVGGESTRPEADPVSADEEWQRISPVLDAARRADHPIPLSVDTTKWEVAARALDAGVVIINDVSALRCDARLADLAAQYQAALILMHMRGTPRTMQQKLTYDDVVREIAAELDAAIRIAQSHGVDTEQILIDPGIGFGKSPDHNLEIIRRLGEFASLKRPLLIGCSRKSFIGVVLDLPAQERLEGTLAAHTAAVLCGAHVVRVHDVRAHTSAMRVTDAVLAGLPRT